MRAAIPIAMSGIGMAYASAEAQLNFRGEGPVLDGSSRTGPSPLKLSCASAEAYAMPIPLIAMGIAALMGGAAAKKGKRRLSGRQRSKEKRWNDREGFRQEKVQVVSASPDPSYAVAVSRQRRSERRPLHHRGAGVSLLVKSASACTRRRKALRAESPESRRDFLFLDGGARCYAFADAFATAPSTTC